VVVGDAIDPNGTKTEPFKTHDVPPHAWFVPPPTRGQCM
jgi:hypothetical protein